MKPGMRLTRRGIATLIWRTGIAVLAIIGAVEFEAQALAAADLARARWEMGRALIHSQVDGSGRVTLILRVSLRNRGRPDSEPVTFLGRWSDETTLRSLERGELERFRRLHTFEQEVSVKNTAILEVSLRPLGSAPRENKTLDVVVLTGSRVTDHKIVVLQRRATK